MTTRLISWRLAVVVIVMVGLLTGCEKKFKLSGHYYGPIPSLDSCVSYDFDIVDLAYDDLPNTGYSEMWARDTNFTRDGDNVMLNDWKGAAFYHPVEMAHKLYAFIDVYHRTGDTALLKLAQKYVARLIQEAMTFDTAMYFPYNFDYKVHARDDALLTAPWFSGMAQGELLGVLVRMFKATEDSTYLDYSHKVFRSFLRLRNDTYPWTSFRDSIGCYWVEEYPTEPPSMTLNGYIFAIFGLYDYFLLTADSQAEEILKASLSTIKNYVPVFRRKGQVSLYNLHFRRFDVGYHRVHIDQLRDLANMTGDPFFAQWADSLNLDYPRHPPVDSGAAPVVHSLGSVDKVTLACCGRSWGFAPANSCDLPPLSSKELRVGSHPRLRRGQDPTQ